MGETIRYFLHDVFPIHMFFFLQITLAELMFFIDQKHKDHFVLRLVFGLIFYTLIAYFHPNVGNKFGRVICIFIWSIAFCQFCLGTEFKKTIFMCMIAYAIQNLSFNLGDLLTRILGLSSTETVVFYVVAGLVFIVTYLLCYFLLVRRFTNSKHFHVKNRTCLYISIITFFVVFSKNAIVFMGLLDDNEVIALFTGLCCALVLAVQFLSVKQSNIEEENRMIEQLLANEKSRQEKQKESAAFISMKYHDLRYFINEHKKNNPMDENFVKEVEENLDIYDNAPDTGNASLNTVLSDKLILCSANHIDISYIVDSEVLNMMEASDVYSLFENALDNAIEASKKEEEDKRMISINVQKKNENGEILIYNYCSQHIDFTLDGLPKTSKDKTYHGFGTKSIRYIVEKYRGSIVFDFSDDLFTISILLPLKLKSN